ncbi:MAG: hypothetical protein ASARMPREDX12_006481 [Alectoria sarmentosa]|nr:MAG: hypothetical protein ASARMPREDX12_006481 [Alectoria sarmentosa]
MSSKTPFAFSSAPSNSSKLDAAMPCYECSLLGYGNTCQDCSCFAATTPMTPPSSPASEFSFTFDFKPHLETTFSAPETTFAPEYITRATKQPRWGWPELESAGLEEPSIKTCRFNWSEMDFSTDENAFETLAAKHEDACSSVSDAQSELYYNGLYSHCFVCSMVPYGAVCTNCDQIQTSNAIVLATPPAAAWPIVNRLGDWNGTKAPEEELLRNLDMDLFEQINVPHELDEWGRRVYNDCGHRILYYQDSDGNTVTGYEAWYPSSVLGDHEEADDWRAGRQAVGNEDQDLEFDDCDTLHSADSDEDTVVGDDEEESENWHMTIHDDVSVIDFEQQRFAEFLAAHDEELPLFRSDRERIAAWIATSSVGDDDDLSISDYETKGGVTMVC